MESPQTPAPHAEDFHDLHLVVDFRRETAHLDGTPLKLTAKTFSLLTFLIRHPGQLVRRETLLVSVWGYREEIRTRTLDVHIRRLRKSLDQYGNAYIETVFGVGYRFQPCRAQGSVQASATASALAERAAAAASAWRWKMEENPAY
jgi:DNA-binding response OmpR family regulator